MSASAFKKGDMVFTYHGTKTHPGDGVVARHGNDGFRVVNDPGACNCPAKTGVSRHWAVCPSTRVRIDIGPSTAGRPDARHRRFQEVAISVLELAPAVNIETESFLTTVTEAGL